MDPPKVCPHHPPCGPDDDDDDGGYKLPASFYKKFFEILHFVKGNMKVFEMLKKSLRLHHIEEEDETTPIPPKGCFKIVDHFYSELPPWELEMAVNIQHNVLFSFP